ncbi:MAG: LysM peptidoglycan-binding domain-containing protein [Bacteroidetes bacterium]|nr:LysM peptidoglycan-binding domain-containing protein [Bacteroidota bacterium]
MRVIRLFSILITLLITPHILFPQDTLRSDTAARKAKFVEDDAVVAMLDSLANLKVFSDGSSPHAQKYPSWSNYTETDIPYFSDSVYAARIAVMNENSPFEYVYNNEVKKFIELYAIRKRKLTARVLGLSEIYFPLFEEQLDRFNMPLELKYLAVIESALNPVANSRAGAKGLWQFMYGTGKVYGLKVSSYVDDRYDPFKATIAACEHLQDLYDIYGNWSLALAAYNSGAGNVNKAIRRSGGLKNFWAIHRYLPRETRSYVPAFIAASYVLAYANEHKISPVDPGILYYEVDTVTVKHPLTFDQLSEMLNIPWDEISFLNPAYKKGIIPATPEVPYKLRLRKKYIGDFINNESAIYAYKTKKALSEDASLYAIYSSYRETQQYTVKKGETMASIAKKFHMSVPEIKALNNLNKNYVRPRQKLFVYVPGSTPKIPDSLLHKQELTARADSTKRVLVRKDTTKFIAAEPGQEVSAPKIHVIKSGESLGLIAGKYSVTVTDLMSWNNLSSSKVVVGQKIKIQGGFQKSTTSSMTPTKAPASKPSAKPSSGNSKFFFYTIQSGDNLWDLADEFNVTVAQIKDLNDIKNASYLKPGQKIKIPK